MRDKESEGRSRESRVLDLPQVDCERDKESEGRSPESSDEVASRESTCFRLRNIEFNLHTVGAKKLGVS